MKIKKSRWLAAPILIVLSSFSVITHARILSVQGTNSPSQLGITSNARSQITWAVVEAPNGVGQAQISSSEGLFFDSTQKTILGRNPQLLTQTRALVGKINTTFILQESLIIPQSVLRTAQDLGLNQIIYVRTFQDNPGATSLANSVTFSLSASGSVGNVSFKQIQMEFDDGRTSTIIATSTPLEANAIISYEGTGLIQYLWEIASPPTTSGQPMFVPLMTKREYLMSGGQKTIKSPSLPTHIAGTYLLRLNIQQPDAQFEMPILRYIVRTDDHFENESVVQVISVQTPPSNAKLTLETKFTWQAITGAQAYQVELYNRPIRDTLIQNSQQEKPLTGIIVPASQTNLKMGQISTTHLKIGSTYFWRVIAISDSGKKIGMSEFRSINY